MRLKLSISAAAALLAALAASAPAGAAIGVSPARETREFVPRQVVVKLASERPRTLRLPAGVGVRSAARALRENPRVEYATPDYRARASALTVAASYLVPNDSGALNGVGSSSGGSVGWAARQWNFLPYAGVEGLPLPTSPGGIDAPRAWHNLAAAGRPGGAGTVVAVIDSGIAYRSSEDGRYRRSPDFVAGQFVPGYDFVDGDGQPYDENGHGTHVAGTIAERTDNGVGLTGLAYRARLMPIRVLNGRGEGRSSQIAEGIRFAVRRGADVINMSFNFGCGKRIPVVDEALREAYRAGVVTVASVGNLHSESCVSPPATGPHVIGVGGTTEGGCLGSYSLAGADVDLLAPGGGTPLSGCLSQASQPIYQVTLRPRSRRQFGVPSNYAGTSMAAAHVSGLAALVLASGVVDSKPGRPPLVRAVTKRLERTSRTLGLPRVQQGAGLIDAGAATTP